MNVDALNKSLKFQFNGFSCIHNSSLPKIRILILWKDNLAKVHLLDMNDQIIHVKVERVGNADSFYATFVYGLHNRADRKNLWNSLTRVGGMLSDPWIVMGDFNSYLSHEDKLGGLPIRNHETVDFCECVSDLHLSDLHQVGNLFTWFNGNVRSKLDRVLVNSPWLLSNVKAFAEYLVPGCLSDHSYYIVSIDQVVSTPKRSFKFLNMWSIHGNFLNIVRKAWDAYIDGNKQFVLKQRLSSLKKPLQKLNAQEFSHISTRAKQANEDLTKEQQLILSGKPQTTDIKLLRIKAEHLLEAERMFLAQKARCDYLIMGDRCSKFFHNLIKRNNKKNAIVTLQNSDGQIITEEDQIANEFVSYYKNLLGSAGTREKINRDIIAEGNMLTQDMKVLLTSQISHEEVRQALFDIDDDKSPGPDGFSSLFYKKSWEVIGSDIVDAVDEFFRTGKLLKQWNHAFIALVPKSSHANKVTDYRPISCCNVFYKIISKILANRLRVVIGDIVDLAQSAFLKNRSIVDNIHLAQELFRKYSRKSASPRCIMKIDIQKAYDTVHWGFLKEALQLLQFPETYINWIMECVSSTAFSISVNGKHHGFFQGKRGLRQGDPLSPYLFAICLEIFSRSVKFATSVPDFNYHPKCQALGITHLAYADDLLLLSRGDIGSVNILMGCLHNFSDTAGLHANKLKSSIYLAGVPEWLKNEILVATGYRIGTLPFRYLGIPLSSVRLLQSDYGPLLDKLKDKVNSWPKNSISHAGRLELIQSVLQGAECYWMTILPFPTAVIKKIYSICRNFFWNSKHCPVSWKVICKPKDCGGLGLRNLIVWNKALLSKQIWNIHNKKDSLWIKWISHYYTKDFWNYIPRTDDSPLIKSLVKIRKELLQNGESFNTCTSRLQNWFDGSHSGSAGAYNWFTQTDSQWPWKPVVCKPSIIPKHRFSLWMFAHKKFLTKDRQVYIEDKNCMLCGTHVETFDHLFFQCKFSKELWTRMKDWLGMHRLMGTSQAVLRAFRGIYRGSSKHHKHRIASVAATIYYIWNSRNKMIFNEESTDVDKIFRKLKIDMLRKFYA